MINLDSRKLKNINKPARYVGGEVNETIKSSNIKNSIVLCYPNFYEKAMSNYIVNLLYNNINDIENIWCKRCFAPDTDLENLLNENKLPLFSLEDSKSIKQSDILLFVIDSELNYTNFINMLNLGGISIYKEDRKSNTPKILVLPLNNINTKPIERFADYIFNYDSEKESIQKLLMFFKYYSATNFVDDSILLDIGKVTEGYKDIEIKQIEYGIVPSIRINNSAIIIDFNYINDSEQIINYIEKSIKLRGINKVSFLNYDKIDSYKFCEIVYKIKSNIEGIRILSKNIDFNRYDPEFFDILLPCFEPSTVYFNVITCSDKLRERIEVGVKKEKLFEKLNKVFKNNRNSIRLDFNIGLPEETYEDIDNIFEVIKEIVDIYSKNRAKDKFSMKVNINYYVPSVLDKDKYNMNSVNKLETKLRYIKEKEYDTVIKLNIEDIASYTTKILLKNGEEDISDVIFDAFANGARFDLYSKRYNENAWEKALFDNIKIVSQYIS